MQQVDHVLLRLKIGEEKPDALEVFECGQVFEQIGLPAHNQLLRLALHARPARKARVDEPLGQLVKLALRRAARALDIGAHIGERAAADAGVEKIARFDKSRRRQTRRRDDDAVLD